MEFYIPEVTIHATAANVANVAAVISTVISV